MGPIATITFPEYTGTRCLMMPYIQGEAASVPDEYAFYRDIIENTYIRKGDIGFLTIDESPVEAGTPHRGARAKYGRALHTEAGLRPHGQFGWGTTAGWGSRHHVLLDRDTEILLANNTSATCALWDAVHENTSTDGDIGDHAAMYPYAEATFMQAGDVHRIGILTPHESLPVSQPIERQFLRIVGKGVHGREPYFTINSLMAA